MTEYILRRLRVMFRSRSLPSVSGVAPVALFGDDPLCAPELLRQMKLVRALQTLLVRPMPSETRSGSSPAHFLKCAPALGGHVSSEGNRGPQEDSRTPDPWASRSRTATYGPGLERSPASPQDGGGYA